METLEAALAAATEQNQALLACLKELVGELDRAGTDVEGDLEAPLADMAVGPAALPHDHTVEISLKDS